MTALEQAAWALLEALDEAERAERAEGGPKGGFIPRPATLLWNAGVFHAATKCAAAKANLRAALAAESGRVSVPTVLPDGSAFFTASLPLRPDHWLYEARPEGWDSVRDCSPDQPRPILTHAQRGAVVTAVRYAIRAATMCGKEMDFDPDALVQNAVVALCGPYGRPLAAAQEGS